MNTLISPAQAIRLAFPDGEYLPAGTLTETDIAAAEERCIVPVIGRALYEKTLSGACEELRLRYLAAPTALCTRLSVQPRLDIRTGRCGTTAPRPDDAQPAPADALARLQKRLRQQATALLRRATDYLETHAGDYPVYDPRCNILNRCTTDGGLVQTR